MLLTVPPCRHLIAWPALVTGFGMTDDRWMDGAGDRLGSACLGLALGVGTLVMAGHAMSEIYEDGVTLTGAMHLAWALAFARIIVPNLWRSRLSHPFGPFDADAETFLLVACAMFLEVAFLEGQPALALIVPPLGYFVLRLRLRRLVQALLWT